MPSILHTKQQSHGKGTSSNLNIKWDKEISFEEAYSALEAKFYSFKKVIGKNKIFCKILNVQHVARIGAKAEKFELCWDSNP